MTDRQSGPQDPASSDDTEALSFLKSLFAVFKDHRNVLMPRLAELMEQCLNTEPLNPDLAESQPKEQSRGDDAEGLAGRKRSDLERKLESMKFDIDRKTKGEAVENALKEKDKLLEESEKTAKCLEEKCLNLEKEIEKKEKEISETKKVEEERISAIKNESENKVKQMSDKAQQLENQLLKEKDDLQKMYGKYQEALKEHKSSHDGMMNELAFKDKEIQEYMQISSFWLKFV